LRITVKRVSKRSVSRLARLAAPVAVLSAATAATDESPLPGPLEAGWKGAAVCALLHEDSHNRILRCRFPENVGHERHHHRPHFGYALAGGRMRISDANGTREVELATGSSFWSDGVDWHEVLNVGDSTVVYLIVEPKQPGPP